MPPHSTHSPINVIYCADRISRSFALVHSALGPGHPPPHDACCPLHSPRLNADNVTKPAEVLDYRNKPGVVVVVTDGEETCGRSPCDLAKQLHANADQLAIHVISFRYQSYSWTGEQSVEETKCLAEQTGGLYITVDTEQDLAAALEKTLDCPTVSQRDEPLDLRR